MGPQEPYWLTNTSFSPPPSRWDFRSLPEGLSFGSHEGSKFYGSSTSPNSRESRNYLLNHHYSVFDGVAQYFSSPDEISPARRWSQPTIQEISVDDYENSSARVLGPLSFSPNLAATSVVHDSVDSTSSRSDSSDYEPISKSQTSHRRSFMSKPVHPVPFSFEREPTRYCDFNSITPQRDKHRFSSGSCDINFTEISSPIGTDVHSHPCNSSDGFKCRLCGRFLSQRSPWSSRRIVRTGDMPVTGVLSCLHVFHAECLEQTTPKPFKNDPPCPICTKSKEENITEQQVCFRSGIPRLGPFREEGPSKQWACSQAGDCVQGALNVPQHNAMLLLSRNRIKNNLSLKGNLGKEFPGKLRKSGSYSSHVFDEKGASSSVKRW